MPDKRPPALPQRPRFLNSASIRRATLLAPAQLLASTRLLPLDRHDFHLIDDAADAAHAAGRIDGAGFLMGILHRAGERDVAAVGRDRHLAGRTNAAIGELHADLLRDLIVRAFGAHAGSPGTEVVSGSGLQQARCERQLEVVHEAGGSTAGGLGKLETAVAGMPARGDLAAALGAAF